MFFYQADDEHYIPRYNGGVGFLGLGVSVRLTANYFGLLNSKELLLIVIATSPKRSVLLDLEPRVINTIMNSEYR